MSWFNDNQARRTREEEVDLARLRVEEARQALAVAERQRQPLKEFLEEQLGGAVDLLAAEYPRMLRMAAAGLERRVAKPLPESAAAALNVLGATKAGAQRYDVRPEALCFFFGDAIKARLRELAKSDAYADWDDVGSPRAKRAKELAQLREELAAAEAELKELQAV